MHSFGYIHAVKMTHDNALPLKRTSNLTVTLFLSDDHDLIILIVNTIHKDLRSNNYYLVICVALNALCKLINDETIPAVLPQVVELLGHSKEAVRKKAVMTLHQFYQKSPSVVAHLVSNFRKKLCDRSLRSGNYLVVCATLEGEGVVMGHLDDVDVAEGARERRGCGREKLEKLVYQQYKIYECFISFLAIYDKVR